jgi:hypothetical protein
VIGSPHILWRADHKSFPSRGAAKVTTNAPLSATAELDDYDQEDVTLYAHFREAWHRRSTRSGQLPTMIARGRKRPAPP